MKKSRREILMLLAGAPCAANASALIDLENGASMFSNMTPRSHSLSGPSIQNFQRHNENLLILRNNLRLVNSNTDEEIVIANHGHNLSKKSIDHFFRDWRQNKTHIMDDLVCSNLFEICRTAQLQGAKNHIIVNSGFRTKQTNDQLRKKSRNVAVNSLHTVGKAIDFYIDGFPMDQLYELARGISKGGVGLYPNFIHIDTGPRRSWVI